jgi:hypothetical protein
MVDNITLFFFSCFIGIPVHTEVLCQPHHCIDFNMLLIADQETGEGKWYQWYKK